MEKQKPLNQKGEIEFRRKLYQQQVEGIDIFQDEFDSKGIEEVLSERMDTTFNQMTNLKTRGVVLSPYLEIGAERGQRSLVMENEIGANGFAADISFDMLKSTGFYQKQFNKEKIPIRICCDANLLPFKSRSFPFVFCYETLHHFPDPIFIMEEIHRVLSPGGYFFFEEEPYNQVLHINLYKGKRVYSKQSLNRGAFGRILDRLFKAPSCNEIEHDIIENHQIPIKRWKQLLSIFDQKEATLKTVKSIERDLYRHGSIASYLLTYLLGGSISGLCKKHGQLAPDRNLENLMCPTCYKNSQSEYALQSVEGYFHCPNCKSDYPVKEDILFLFERNKMKELYPDITL